MAEMLKGKVLFVPVLGILLNKRRKDPRLHYKTETMAQIGAETESKFLEENSLNADFYRKYLEKEYGIVRYEWESCGYDMALPPGKKQPASSFLPDQYLPVLHIVCKVYDRRAGKAEAGRGMSEVL